MRSVLAVLAVAAAMGTPVCSAAQEVQDSGAVADSVPSGPGPAGAFLRGALIPGWGHTVSGSLTRGAFYFGVDASAGWMLFKTMRRLRAARQRQDFWEARVTSRLAASGVTDPDSLAAGLDENADVARVRNLVDAREEQREDWLAVTLFFLLVSGVDAFVSAHLQDFPQPLTIEGDPTGERLEVGVRVPVGWFGGN